MASTTHLPAQHLRSQIFYQLDCDLSEPANFLAGRLHALEPRNPDSSHLLALTYLRLRRFRAALDASQKYGANGRHLGCAWVFAQACLQLEKFPEGAAALEKAKASWHGKSSWNAHSETRRRHLPDAAAVWVLMGKLWQGHGDWKKAGDCLVEAHKLNPFLWEAFEGLCKIGADLRVENMFKPTAEMGVASLSAGSAAAGNAGAATEIYTDEPTRSVQPLAPQTNFNQQVFTPSADPFNTSRTGSEASQFVLPNLKEKAGLGKVPSSDWDTPTTVNAGVLDDDVSMGGVLVENDGLITAPQPPPAPARRVRTGHPDAPAERPRPPALRGHATSASEGHEDISQAPRKSSAAAPAGHKRTISGQQPSAAGNEATGPPRRSNRLFGHTSQATRPASSARSESSNTTSTTTTASVAGRGERGVKPATGTKGRIGSTVGRVVSGNRKMLPPDRNGEKEKEREKRAPSRNSEKTAPISTVAPTAHTLSQQQKAAQPTQAEDTSQADALALNSVLSSFRDLAIGTYALSRFDTPTSIHTFKSLPSAQRETPHVLAQLGTAYYEAGDYKAAEDCFARVLKLQPSRLQDMDTYSTVLWHLKKEAALAFLCHHLRAIAPKEPQTWLAIGNAFSLTREHDQALSAFKRATQLDPKFAYAYTLIGHEYILNEEFDAALASFRQAVSLDRRNYGGWYGLGKSYERLGKLEESERHYRIASSINPTNSTLLVCIGVVLERLRNRRGALANYSKALEITPTSALARFKKARVLMHLRYFSEALVELEVLREQAPDEANVWFLLGKCYKGLGERGEALRCLTTALNLDVKAAAFIKEAMEALDEEDEEGSEDD